MKLGIIGFGNVAQAFVKGILTSDHLTVGNIKISERTEEQKAMAKELFGVESYNDNLELVEKSDYVMLAVKPINYVEVLDQIRGALKGKVLISYIVGTSLKELEKHLDPGTKVIRVMPNVAMAVRESLSTLCANEAVSKEEFDTVFELFDNVGTALVTNEADMDKISAISASGLGFVAYWMSALEKSAIDLGIDEKNAEIIAVQTFKGAAQTVWDTKYTATDLMHRVATKGGTTIEGLNYMEEMGVSQAIVDGVDKTYRKGLSFSKRD